MESNNRSVTLIIVVAVIIILGVRFFLSNRESISSDTVQDKINTAVEATQTTAARNPTREPIEVDGASGALRSSLTPNPVNGTISAQETRIAALQATNDAQYNLTPILAPTLTPTPPSAVGAIRAENTAQALQLTVDAQDAAIANLQATNQALAENMTPTRTPVPTMVDTPDPIVMSIDSTSNLFTLNAMGNPTAISLAPSGEKVMLQMNPISSIRVESGAEPVVINVGSGGDDLFVMSPNLAFLIFDLNSGELTPYFAGDLGSSHVVAWSPDSAYIAIGDESGHIFIWDVATTDFYQQFQVSGEVQSMSWSPNGALFAVQTSEALTLFYANTWSEMITYDLRDGQSFAWSSSSEHLIYSDGNTVHVVAMNDLYTQLTLARFNNPIQIVTWSPDGQFLALVDNSDEHTIYLQVWPDKNVLYAFSGGAELNSLTWSPDSRYIMADGNQAQIWEVATGTKRYVLDSNTLIRDAQWLPDNSFIALLADSLVLWPNPVLDAQEQ